MFKDSKPLKILERLRSDLLSIVILATIIKLLFLVALYFLPKSSIEFVEKPDTNRYHFFNLSRALAISKEKIEPVVNEGSSSNLGVSTAYSLKELTLKAIYKNDETSGFVLVLDKSSKSHIISIGESHMGYTLVRLEERKAIFTKESKEYMLEILDDGKVAYTPKRVAPAPVGVVQTKDRVSREEINQYKNNLNLIWRDIKIQPHYEAGQINGFAVQYVKRGSVFEALGLQAGDRLIRGNGMALTSVKDALTLYKQIDKIKVFKLVVIRNSREVELEYEVY